MTILWTEKTVAEATGGKAQGTWQATGVSIDSRTLKPGDLFVAIKGDNFDGHDYVQAALDNGAAAAVVSRIPKDIALASVLLVGDTMKALAGLGVYARSRSRAKIVGVTGSVGKTSSKEMLRLALSAHGVTFATTGNLNNHIGTPLNLANLPPDAPFAVFEMGMNHAGEIAALTRMVKPHVAAITNIEAVHLEFFGTIEKIADAKAEIFDGVGVDGVAVLNADNPLTVRLREKAVARGITKILTFGAHEQADCRLLEYRSTALGSSVSANIYGAPLKYTLGAVGRHWALTSLLTLVVTHTLGLDDVKTVQALAAFKELEGRGAVHTVSVRGNPVVLVDDSYNASPAAMCAAFAKLDEVWQAGGKKGRKLAALGDMLELGKDAPALHMALAEDIRQVGFDGIFACGELMKNLYDTLPPELRVGYAPRAMALLPLMQTKLRAGDVLLVKGSHGSKMYEVVKALRGAQ